MTRKQQMTARNRDGKGQPAAHSDCAANARTRRDLLAMAFTCSAAVALRGVQAPVKAPPGDVLDGGAP